LKMFGHFPWRRLSMLIRVARKTHAAANPLL
jgi:hypothetical protein